MTKRLTLLSLFCALMVVSAWVTIPFALPFTLQTLILFLCIGLLGWRSATLCVTVYLLLGCVGLPVFSAMQGGAGVLLGPTGGYLLGFLVVPFVAGGLLRPKYQFWQICLCFTAGLGMLYLCGSLWYALVYVQSSVGFWGAMTTCVVPYLVPDLLKLGLSAFLTAKVNPFFQKTGWKRW